MKKNMAVIWAVLMFALVTNAAIDSQKDGDRYVITRNAPVRISVETGWQRDGRIPVRINIKGLSIDLIMDSEGRVFDDARLESWKTDKTKAISQELFRLDKTNGQLQAGDKILNGRIFEKNALRTRLRLENLELALQLDIQKSQAVLDLNGIAIPVRMRLGNEVGGIRELEIGEWGNRGEGHFLLDARQGRLFFEATHARPSAGNRQNHETYWAERQK